MNSNMYCDILKQSMILSLQKLCGMAVFQLDNDPKHTSKMTTALPKECPGRRAAAAEREFALISELVRSCGRGADSIRADRSLLPVCYSLTALTEPLSTGFKGTDRSRTLRSTATAPRNHL
ncbi:hypothetical protein AOLI_G00176720 [Acnodon oligacanthus]